jgi:hypothetical protein
VKTRFARSNSGPPQQSPGFEKKIFDPGLFVIGLEPLSGIIGSE